MRKGKIVIASILKPINDTRLFEKFALSLGQTNKYDINIIGFCAKKIKSLPNITFYPLFNFKRTSPKRIGASLKYYRILLKVKPDIIIVTTAELLIISVIYKILFGSKLCYDVQENYYRNIRFTSTYPSLIKTVLAHMVRGIEQLCSPFVDQYFLAEQCYTHEIDFPKEKTEVILNKFKPLGSIQLANPVSNRPTIKFLYTGTLAYNYGILEAIDFTKNISNIYPFVSLEIIGYAPDPKICDTIKIVIRDYPFIQLKGGGERVPHQNIIAAIPKADFALLPYQPDKSIENCFPTKIWEYMAHGLPMIIQNHAPWVSFCQPYRSCIAIDYKNYIPKAIINQMLTEKFYPNGIPEDIFWHSEELTLLKSIEKVIKSNMV